MTHLHPDHASAISDFPEATFLVSTAEWEAAADGGQRDGYVKRQFDHGFDYRLVDFDSDDANSFSGFARSFDVFGDGSVRIVFTPGHTLGHMSVVLRTEHGEVLVAGDAIFMRRTLDDDHLPHMTCGRAPLPPLAARDPAVREGDAGRRRRSRGTTGRPGRSSSRSTSWRTCRSASRNFVTKP